MMTTLQEAGTFSVYREIEDAEDLMYAQTALQDAFGKAVTPIETAADWLSRVSVMTDVETKIVFDAAAKSRDAKKRGIDTIVENLCEMAEASITPPNPGIVKNGSSEESLKYRARRHIVAHQFLLKPTSLQDKSIVYLVVPVSRQAPIVTCDRESVVKAIFGDPHAKLQLPRVPDYHIPIASVNDPVVAEEISVSRLTRSVELSVGQLIVER